MSEVQSRPAPRGRGSARGGRGGFSSRGGRGGRGQAAIGDKLHGDTDVAASNEDDGEVAQLKKKYGGSVTTIKDMFPEWTDEDIVFALEETDGDLETTVDRIATGSITRWGEVSNTKKDRSKSKVKDAFSSVLGDSTNQNRTSRAGRAGFEGGRGRGRGTDRGRGGSRGGRGASVAHTNGSRTEQSETLPPAAESSAWDTPAPSAWDAPAAKDEAPAWETPKDTESSWDTPKTEEPHSTVATAAKVASSIIPDGVKKSWASMFAPAPPAKKEKEKAPEPAVEKHVAEEKVSEPVEAPTQEVDPVEALPASIEEATVTPPAPEKAEPVDITPSKDELTETNLEQVLDTSAPPPTATAASTAASSWDPRNATASSTPIGTQQNTAQPIRPPPTSGFQASALKATGTPGRSASYQRRVLDQEEAVRMPGNREVDRAAVQFGAFNLGTGEEDVDGEREEAETRVQPPQHSPSAPRASLPPAPQQAAGSAPESLPTPKQTSGLPASTAPTAAPGLPSPVASQNAPGATSQNTGSFGRYGQNTQESYSLPQKPYDAFGQQAPSQSPFDSNAGQHYQSQQAPSGAFSSTPADFAKMTPEEQYQAYQNHYQQQQYAGQSSEGPASQHRGYNAYGAPRDSSGQFPPSGTQQPSSRYTGGGEGQNSGHNTPNPTTQSQHQGGQGGQPQQSGHPGQHGYPYGHPYYSSPYYAAYMNQQQQNAAYYNTPYGSKGGHYAQPYQGYGSPYEQAPSPAGGVFGGSSLHGRDSAVGGGLDSYGRAASAQSSQPQSGVSGSTAFGGSHDTFGRNSGYQSQAGYGGQQGNPQASTDDLKPFGETKSGNGPSPSLAHAGRPGSATNTPSGTGLPPPQSQQGAYGGYPHLQQQGHGGHSNQANSQYSGLNQAGSHQASQGHQSPYGGYGGFGYGATYGNNNQQQRGGWGGNYGH